VSLPPPTSYAVTFQVQDAVGQIGAVTINWALAPTFTYTHNPAVNGLTPDPTTVQIHGTMGIGICPGTSGNYYFQLLTNHQGLLVHGGSAATGQAIDNTLTLGTEQYNEIQLNCSGNNTTDALDGFTVSSLPTISTNPLLQPGIVGQSYSTTLQYSLNGGVTGFGTYPAAPYTWSVTNGSLPDGLSLDPSSGIISGTPTAAANSTFTAQVTDALGQSSSEAMTVFVFNPNSLLTITTTSLPQTSVGSTYSQSISLINAFASTSWSISSGALPDGLTINPSTGVISGTARTAGTL
jgi:hypothetical protein